MRVLSLGAGVQSSTLLLMAVHGELDIDFAVFADTQWEPEGVYEWLNMLRDIAERAGIPLEVVTAGNIRADALNPGKRFASMPVFSRGADGMSVMGRRQCTREYKVAPIRRWLRKHGATAKTPAELLIGVSLDEWQRMRVSDVAYYRHVYPLIDRRLTRLDCLNWLTRHGYPEPTKSACIGCPFRPNHQWRLLTDDEWVDAVEFDSEIRSNRGTEVFLHRDLVPLTMVDLSTEQDRGQLDMFDGCGVLCPAGDI